MVRWVGLLSIITVFATVLAYMYAKGVQPLAGIFTGIYACCVLYSLDYTLKEYEANPGKDPFNYFLKFIWWASVSGVVTFCAFYLLKRFGL